MREVDYAWDEFVIKISWPMLLVGVPEENFEWCVEKVEENNGSHERLPEEKAERLGQEHRELPEEVLEFSDSRVLWLETFDSQRIESFADASLGKQRLIVLGDVE